MSLRSESDHRLAIINTVSVPVGRVLVEWSWFLGQCDPESPGQLT